MKQNKITPRQLQILQSLADYRASRHYSATISELAALLKLGRTTVFGHIAELRKKGLLIAADGKARSLELTSLAVNLLEDFKQNSDFNTDIDYQGEKIPLLGRVAAGNPIEAIQDDLAISLQEQFGLTDDVFALEVRGDSMIEENICDGDYVICKKTTHAANGQLAVILVEDENVTLKRFYKEKDHARLQPANKNYLPIYSNDCKIEAIVLGLVRKY